MQRYHNIFDLGSLEKLISASKTKVPSSSRRYNINREVAMFTVISCGARGALQPIATQQPCDSVSYLSRSNKCLESTIKSPGRPTSSRLKVVSPFRIFKALHFSWKGLLGPILGYQRACNGVKPGIVAWHMLPTKSYSRKSASTIINSKKKRTWPNKKKWLNSFNAPPKLTAIGAIAPWK